MKTEKIVLSFIAVVIGLAVAGAAFYLYQTTKTIPESQTRTPSLVLTPTPKPYSSIFLTVESPKDEEVFDKKTITITGKTEKDAIIIISTNTNDEVITPALNGNFSTTTTIENGQNQIAIIAVSLSGEEKKIVKTVTFSTEEF